MRQKAETALIGNIQKFSVEDGPGIRTTIFLKGCPLSCRWCHNPELIQKQQQLMQIASNCIGCKCCIQSCPQGAIQMRKGEGITIDRNRCDVCLICAEICCAKALKPVAAKMNIEEIIKVAEQDRGFYENTGGGITISGGELLAQADFVEKLIDRVAAANINVCLDTSGFGDSHALWRMANKENVTDILYDMKAIDDQVHMAYTGVSNEIILKNLKMLSENSEVVKKITMRMPLLKGVNDSEEMVLKTGKLYQEIGIRKVDLLPYHNLGISKQHNVGGSQECFNPPEEDKIEKIKKYFEKAELKVEVLGRV